MLATLARTRAQLSGMSTIMILTMSSLGGSMFPRFLMSETMQKIGLLTFNAWALDGYLKVFWRNAPVWQLWPQVLRAARRWRWSSWRSRGRWRGGGKPRAGGRTLCAGERPAVR